MFTEQMSKTPVRLVFLAVVFFAVNAVVVGPLSQMVHSSNPFVALVTLVLGVAAAAGMVWLYRWVIGKVEHREATELAPVNVGPALRRGALLGMGMFTAVMLLITIFGGYESLSWGSFTSALATAGMMASVAVIEEILFRGVLFRLVEQMTGTVGAMVVSALVFGGLHLLNSPNLWGALAIAIQGGLMLAAVYAATRSLWLPIGLHFGWNFAESGIFGTTVSGSDNSGGGIFSSVLDGPTLISGGDFGPEATIFAVLVCSVLTVVYTRRITTRTREMA